MAAAIQGEQSRWVREDNVTTYVRQNTKLSLTLVDRINPATTLPEVMAVATRFDWFLQLLGDGVAAEELWDLFFDDSLPHNEMEARDRVRVALLLTEDSAGFEEDGDGDSDDNEGADQSSPIEYKSMDGPPRRDDDSGNRSGEGHQLRGKGRHQHLCLVPLRGQPPAVIGLGEDYRHRLGMKRRDQRVGLAREEGEDLGRDWRLAFAPQGQRWLFR